MTAQIILPPPEASVNVPIGAIVPFAGAVDLPFLTADGSAVSRTDFPLLYKYLVTDLGFTSQAFTVTIANPAVFTKTAHGFTANERIRLSTTGALPAGLSTLIDYYVNNLTADTFSLSTTLGGTPVATSGAQSGTHSYMRSLYGLGDGSTTFNVPKMNGQVPRMVDLGAGVDVGRTLGTLQLDDFKAHSHVTNGVVVAWVAPSGQFNMAAGTAFDTIQLRNVPTYSAGGAETRMRNIAFNFGIRAK